MRRLFGRCWGGFLILWFSGLLAQPVTAQVLDPAFQPVETHLAPTNALVGTMQMVEVVKPDAQGRLLVAGRFDFLGPLRGGNLTRLLPNGTVDPTFNVGGSGSNGAILALQVLPSGKLLIGGQFTHYNGQPVGYFACLNPDGTLDPTFNVGGIGADQRVRCITLDPQGRVFLGGDFSFFNGQRVGRIARLLPTGGLDGTFVSGNPGFTLPPSIFHPDSYVASITVARNGRILVGGDFSAYDGQPRPCIARLLSGGGLDTTFSVNGLSRSVTHIMEMANGKLLIGGSFVHYDRDLTPQFRMGLIRTEATGRVDTTFHQINSVTDVSALLVRANGQILAGGSFPYLPGNRRLVQFNPDGTVDTQFPVITATGIYRTIRSLVELPTGRLLVGGTYRMLAGQPATSLTALSPAATIDPSFAAPLFDQRAPILQLAVQPDDRLLVRGNFGLFNGLAVPPLVRLTANGALDPTFQLDSAVHALSRFSLAPNGQVYVLVGNHVRRVTSTGVLDSTFNDGTGFTASSSFNINQLLVQPDGRLLVAGPFTQVNGVARSGLVRLETDGSVDQQFAPAMQVLGLGTGVALRPDGHVLAWVNAGQSDAAHLYCLDGTTGGRLSSFHNGQPVDSLEYGVVLPDTSVLALGPYGVLVHLTAAGFPDPNFQLTAGLAGARFNGNRPTVLPNGKILVRTDYRSQPHLWCINSDGSVDPRFTPLPVGTDFYSSESLLQVLPQSNGKLILSGGFLNVGAASQFSLARLTNPVVGLSAAAPVVSTSFDAYPNPAHATFTLRRPTAESATATLLDVLGRPVRQWPLTAAETRLSVAGLPAGTYVVRVVGTSGVLTRHVVVE